MKKLIIICSILLIGIIVNVNLSSNKNDESVSSLTLQNIHLLQANAEIGSYACTGGCMTGTPNDVCIRCSDCVMQLWQKGLGWTGSCG